MMSDADRAFVENGHSPKLEVAGPSPSSPRTLVDRPRLYRLLDQATLSPLTLVTSPAGTGKTTLIAAWVAQTSIELRSSVHWLAAHAHDGMQQHLLQAVGLSAADARDAVRRSRRNALEDAEWLLVRLEAEVDAGRTPQLVVVDDAHL